ELGALAGGYPGEWLAQLFVDLDGDGEPEALDGWGFLNPLEIEEEPTAPTPRVGLVFTDGFQYLRDRAAAEWMPSGSRSARYVVERVLYALGGGNNEGGPWVLPEGSFAGLTVAVDWFPRLPDGVAPLAAGADPLLSVRVPRAAFESSGGASASELVALEAVAARFGARLFQSGHPGGARYYLLQRELLARDASAVPATEYGREVDDDEPRASLDLLQEIDLAGGTYQLIGDARRPRSLPVRAAQSTYGYQPRTFGLIENGSFEEQGAADGGESAEVEDARYWDFTTSFVPVERTNIADPFVAAQWGLEAASGDVWAAAVAGYGSTESRSGALQRLTIELPASADWHHQFTYTTAYKDLDSVSGDEHEGPVRLQMTDPEGGVLFGVEQATVEVNARVLPGPSARVFVRSALSAVTGAVLGVRALPAGVTLKVYREIGGAEAEVAELALDEPLAVGDTAVYGTLRITNGT
ncbi:MAG TPA: hypothetical protein VD838_06070, partial [Anaeromyxobacteraceae bacterium]|nr:hypothetical protein [Anaeromyxobacteraceae bacterium]